MTREELMIRGQAWMFGFRDGWAAPRCLSSGMTWTDGPWLEAGANEAYDRGVNAGQRLRSPLHHESHDEREQTT